MYTRKRSVFEIYRISKKNSNEESSFSRYLFKFLRSKDKCSFTRIEFESLSLVIGGQVRDKLCSRHAQICRSRAHFRRTRETRSSRGGEVWNGKELSVESFLWVERQNALLCSVFERWRLSKECWLWLLKYNSLFLPFLSSPSSLLDHRADLERSSKRFSPFTSSKHDELLHFSSSSFKLFREEKESRSQVHRFFSRSSRKISKRVSYYH